MAGNNRKKATEDSVPLRYKDGKMGQTDPLLEAVWFCYCYRDADFRDRSLSIFDAEAVFGKRKWLRDGHHGPAWFKKVLERGEKEGLLYSTDVHETEDGCEESDYKLWFITLYGISKMLDLDAVQEEHHEWEDWNERLYGFGFREWDEGRNGRL